MHDHQIVQMLRDVLTNQQRLLNGQSHFHDQEKRIMADLTKLTQDVNQLQTDVTSLNGLVTNTVVPDIQKAIALIQGGDSQAAIDALDGIVTATQQTLATTNSSLQSADSSLESAEAPTA